ncbi:hypothetical protein HBH69_168350 [Parastagonospora nodorum]|nr:hypothetical protein HBI06_232960 [Parastagonospora nodorum]KAH4232432.1 hypothetical protein HBI05_172460 [Parastagonospora nodorum]KAH4804538.1 hypothetical protein HBH61_172240 [Parastagonospora nodorum]KAH4978402.1 hypothetical protein HBI76_209080 [Parastagonospora nodorum]KAH5147590.1 hypothetical protein HBH69_168350 [Parastagonospora nodorum]
MPHYMVYHSCDISQQQYQAFASALTKLHCDLFSAPSAFVNITFLPSPSSSSTSTSSPTVHTFVGAHSHPTNFIHAHLRPRGPSNAPKLHTLVTTTMALWSEHIGTDSGRLDDIKALHNVFIFEDLAAGAEQGFVVPRAGGEGEWARENKGEFERREREGDEGMGRLVGELKAKMGE